MQKELEELQPQLVKASAENEKMMKVGIAFTVMGNFIFYLCVFVCVSFYLFVYLFVCLSVCLSVCVAVCFSAYHFV